MSRLDVSQLTIPLPLPDNISLLYLIDKIALVFVPSKLPTLTIHLDCLLSNLKDTPLRWRGLINERYCRQTRADKLSNATESLLNCAIKQEKSNQYVLEKAFFVIAIGSAARANIFNCSFYELPYDTWQTIRKWQRDLRLGEHGFTYWATGAIACNYSTCCQSPTGKDKGSLS